MDKSELVAVVTAAVASIGNVILILVTWLANNRRFDRIEHRLEIIETDLKEFYRHLGRVDTDIARLKDKTGLPNIS